MDTERYIKENYKKIPTKQIAEQLGIKVATVKRLANKIGVGSFSRETELLVPEILDKYYKKKLTIKTISSQVGLSKVTLKGVLKKYGVGGRTRSEMNIKYSCDIDYFTNIDTPEKAYWFGFIAADGNLCEGKVTISLHKKDFSLLKKFKKALKYKGNFYFNKKSPMISIRIRRQKLYESLKKHGLMEAKTHKIDDSIFLKIPENLVLPAIHGYFDGDGCFSLVKNTGVSMSILGNESFLLYFRDFFVKNGLDFGAALIKKDKRTRFTYSFNKYLNKDNMVKIYNLFYNSENSSKDFLDRKRKKLYDQICDVGLQSEIHDL